MCVSKELKPKDSRAGLQAETGSYSSLGSGPPRLWRRREPRGYGVGVGAGSRLGRSSSKGRPISLSGCGVLGGMTGLSMAPVSKAL